MPDVKFEVGQSYTNRQGTYEVLAVDSKRGRMEVRFLGGAARSLDLVIQARILQNLRLEDRIAEKADLAKAKPARAAGGKKGLGREFAGMRPEDFMETVTGTTWRNRGSLAGGVAARLQRHFLVPFKSVAPYRWPKAFLSHRTDELSRPAEAPWIAKYVLWTDRESLHFGLYLERLDERYRDWERFLTRLTEDGELRASISELEQGGLRVHGGKQQGDLREPLMPEDASWEVRLDAMDLRHDGEYRDLYLSFSLPKDEAIARGTSLMDDVGEALVKLAPLYHAATA